MNIDVGRSVTYAFEDPEWVRKVGILTLLGFIPGLNLIMWSGYGISVARNILQGERFPLPDWGNWSDIAVRGLLTIAATFIYYLPAFLIGCCLWLVGLVGGQDSGGLSLAIRCCGGLFAILYVLAANFLLNAGHVRFVQTDQFNVYLDFGRRFEDIRRETNFYVTLFFYELLLGLLAGVASAVLGITCLGPIAIGTIAFLANGYILGEAAAASRRFAMSAR